MPSASAAISLWQLQQDIFKPLLSSHLLWQASEYSTKWITLPRDESDLRPISKNLHTIQFNHTGEQKT